MPPLRDGFVVVISGGDRASGLVLTRSALLPAPEVVEQRPFGCQQPNTSVS